jgi:NADH:ubiquinone oxidoreductase subunit D
VVFGVVAIDDHVISLWLGDGHPTYPLDVRFVSEELARVSIFLAAFSGLYFTVYAVTDSNYRQQFFTQVMRELGRVVGARICYRELRRTQG